MYPMIKKESKNKYSPLCEPVAGWRPHLPWGNEIKVTSLCYPEQTADVRGHKKQTNESKHLHGKSRQTTPGPCSKKIKSELVIVQTEYKWNNVNEMKI